MICRPLYTLRHETTKYTRYALQDISILIIAKLLVYLTHRSY